MILQNKNGENKVFIDDSILNSEEFEITELNIINKPSIEITQKELKPFNILSENMDLYKTISILYDPTADQMIFSYDLNGTASFYLRIKEYEIVELDICEKDSITINIMELPKFMLSNNIEDKYPKFDINLSDCVYSMKIYLNDHEYIDIPLYQSHLTIHGTLEYISELVYFLEETPDFLKELCECKELQLAIYKDSKAIACEIYDYKIGETGIILTEQVEEPESKTIDYHKFFKLIMDGTWEVDFYK